MVYIRTVPQKLGSLAVIASLAPLSWTYAEEATSDAVSPDRGALRMPSRDFSAGKLVIKPKADISTITAPVVTVPSFVLEDVIKRKFSLQGLSVAQAENIDQAKMNEVISPWLNRELSFAEFQEVSQVLASYLRANGHPNAEVKISQMQFKEGQAAIAIAGLTPPVVASEPKLAVIDIQIQGLTVVSEADIKQSLTAYLGKDLTLKQLGDMTEAVATHLRNKGYVLAQAYLPPQKIDQGVITVAVQEGIVDGSLGKGGIVINGGEATIKPEVVQEYLAEAVVPDKPLNVNKLERALRIVQDTPGVESIKTNLVPGSQSGTTQVVADVISAKSITASLSADNFGNPYMGEGRLSAAVNVNSPSGHGEQYFVNLSKSSGAEKADGMQNFKLGGHAPIGFSGLRMGASYSKMDVSVGGNQQLINLGISNNADIASIFASYPLEKSATSNIYVTASFDNKHYINDAKLTQTGSSALNSDRLINALNMGISGDLFGSWGGKLGWGVNLALAHNDLSGNKLYRDNFDKPAANTQGDFTKLNANVNHIISIAQDWYLYAALSAQWADKNLDSAEKFQLGGPFGVRAYPVGEGLGDHGWLATAEVRHNVGETQLGNVEVFGFADTGGVTQFVTTYSTAFEGKQNNRNTYELSGVGLGVGMTYKDTGNLRVMVAEKVGSNPNPSIFNTDADGRKDNTRIWVVGTIVF